MKAIVVLWVLIICSFLSFGQILKISENNRYLVYPDGKPFFYLGDTGWELFHRLTRKEADKYLKRRAEQGFTVIQAVILAELDGLNEPNPYGHKPLLNNDPSRPVEEYFQHVDYIINKAAEYGLFIGLLPTWGDKLYKDSWGKGPEIFNAYNAKVYGEYLGQRYAGKNVIWILGGDRNPQESHLPVWRAMAAGIEKGAGGRDNALLSFHPQPTAKNGGSSTWFHQDGWLDFNMFQTGHCRDIPRYEKIAFDYGLTPIKPTMDAEPIYEDHPVCFNAKELGYSTPADIRKAAYLDLFAGAHGHTYGCHAIWQFYSKSREPINGPLKTWEESMELAGANDMIHVRKLMESRPLPDRIPDQSLISTPALEKGERIQATRGKDYLFVYSAAGKPFGVKMGKISGKELKGYWYNPRDGKSTEIGTFKNSGESIFTPPGKGWDEDWVLILDDSTKSYPTPDQINLTK